MPYDSCPVYQPIDQKCPKCGYPLRDDRVNHIWCSNPDCSYEEHIDDEPFDIGEQW